MHVQRKGFTCMPDQLFAPELSCCPVCLQLLGSHFVAAPLRDEAAVALGTDKLPQLFAASLAGVCAQMAGQSYSQPLAWNIW
jgi:hypothetical protein